jgi:hypothetical protein
MLCGTVRQQGSFGLASFLGHLPRHMNTVTADARMVLAALRSGSDAQFCGKGLIGEHANAKIFRSADIALRSPVDDVRNA